MTTRASGAETSPITGLTLVVEASTTAGSVAAFRGDSLVGHATAAMGASSEDRLFPAMQAVLGEAGVLDGTSPGLQGVLREVVCGGGPGSFTSLRIAAAAAKGLAHATGASLYAVPSLLLAAAAHQLPGRYLVHRDALRGEHYVLPVCIDDEHRVHADGVLQRLPVADLVGAAGDRSLLEVAGGASVSAALTIAPDASQLMRIADWRSNGPVDLAGWEPDYGRLAEAQVKWEATHAQALPRA